MVSIDLNGHHALITGSGRGLGKAIALRLAEAGASVCFTDINSEAANQACQEGLEKGYTCYAYPAIDVSDYNEVKRMIYNESDNHGLDIMVNAAGMNYVANLTEVEPSGLQRLIEVNISGVTYGCALAMEVMLQKSYGRIINIASIAGRRGVTTRPYYAMTKAAVINLTQSAAFEGAKRGVTVNAICPGIIRTDMWELLLNDLQKRTGKSREELWCESLNNIIPMGIPQEEIDIANAVLYLSSDMGRYITGQSLNVCGGARMN